MADLTDGQPPPWHASAAYLYALHLDGPALAWEYLRRHPGYRLAWRLQATDAGAARPWGLRTLEDPTLDGIFRTFADDCLELIEAELTVRAI